MIWLLSLAMLLQTSAASTTDRWRLSADESGLTARVDTELGHGVEIALLFFCNAHGRASIISRQGDYGTPRFHDYLDTLMPPNSDPTVETYRAGQRTGRFSVTGPHPEGARDPVTDGRLMLVRDADFIVLVGGRRPVLLPTTNASTVIAQFMAACAVTPAASQG